VWWLARARQLLLRPADAVPLQLKVYLVRSEAKKRARHVVSWQLYW